MWRGIWRNRITRQIGELISSPAPVHSPLEPAGAVTVIFCVAEPPKFRQAAEYSA